MVSILQVTRRSHSPLRAVRRVAGAVGVTLCLLTATAWLYTSRGNRLQWGHNRDLDVPQYVLQDNCLSICLGVGWLATDPPRAKGLGYLDVPRGEILIALATPTLLLFLPLGRRPR